MWSRSVKAAVTRGIGPALLATGGSIIAHSRYHDAVTTASAEPQPPPPPPPGDTTPATAVPPSSSSSTGNTPQLWDSETAAAAARKVCRLNELFANSGGVFRQISQQLGGREPPPPGRTSSTAGYTNKEDSVDLDDDAAAAVSIRDNDDSNSKSNTTTTGTSDLLGMLFAALQSPSRQQQQKSIHDIVETIRDVRSRQQQQEGVVEGRKTEACVLDFFRLLDRYGGEAKHVADTYGKHLDLHRFHALAMLYYLEHEDEMKNPSWKRRMHRFFPGIGSTQMDQLNSALQLSALSYADTVPELEEGLAALDPHYQMVAGTVDSAPGQPAYFLALHKHQDDDYDVWSGGRRRRRRRAILVIRGSKNVADTLTDVICQPVPYRDGQAHAFILESGRYIAGTTRDLLADLFQSTGLSLSELDLTIIGHSLGAGAATIAAMELRAGQPAPLDVNVIGFGGPAILSQNLAEATASYVTSVINNDDVVPRMSGAAVANVIAKILEFNWIDYAELDITQALDEITKGLPLPQAAKQLLLENVRSLVKSVASDDVNAEERKGPEPLPIELYPAGKCIHLYRDGVGISGCIVPNTFFNQIDVSRTMLSDHLAHNGYELTLLDIERQRTGNYHFKFDQASL